MFACVTLIASDIGKVRLRLVEAGRRRHLDGNREPGVLAGLAQAEPRPDDHHASSNVDVRRSCSTAIRIVLKQRDDRGVVTTLYILDPTRVTPLVTPDGAVYYRLSSDALAGVDDHAADVTVPAREIMHDRFNCLLSSAHRRLAALCGRRPGAARAEDSGQPRRGSSRTTRGPSGILTAPGEINNDQAARFKERWEQAYSRRELRARRGARRRAWNTSRSRMTAVDAQLTEQDKRTSELICAAYHVPASLVDSSHAPPYANSEPLMQQYYSQCLQAAHDVARNVLGRRARAARRTTGRNSTSTI